MKRILLACALLAALYPVSAGADSTAQPVINGYLATTGCPGGSRPPCFIQYGASGGGGGSASTLPPSVPVGAPQIITATSVSSTITLGASTTTYPALWIKNTGPSPANYALSGTALTTGDVLNANGSSVCLPATGVTQVAGITSSASLTSTIEVWQMSFCPTGTNAGTGASVQFGSAAAGTVSDPVLTTYDNGAAAVTVAPITITTSATLIAAAAAGGTSLGLEVQNCGTVDVYLGGASVATTTGWKLAAPPAGAAGQCNSAPWPFSGALYGIVAAGTQEIRFRRYN